MKQSIRIFTVILGVIFTAQAYAQTTIYQWVDSQGRTNYTQVKPEYTVRQSVEANKDGKAPLIPDQAQTQTKDRYNVKVFEPSKAMLINIKPRPTSSEYSKEAAPTEIKPEVITTPTEAKIEAVTPATEIKAKAITAVVEAKAEVVTPATEIKAKAEVVTPAAEIKTDAPTTEPQTTELKLALSDTDQSDPCITAKHNLSTLEGYADGKVNVLKLKNSDGTETTLTKDQIQVLRERTLKEVDAFCVK